MHHEMARMVGERIRLFRTHLDLSQRHYCTLHKFSKATLSSYENGHVLPHVDMVIIPARLGGNPLYFLGQSETFFEPPMTRNELRNRFLTRIHDHERHYASG